MILEAFKLCAPVRKRRQCLRTLNQQVFLNILETAPSAAIHQECRQSWQPSFNLRLQYNDLVCAEIEDNGWHGRNVRRRIFEPFFTTKFRLRQWVGSGSSLFYYQEVHHGSLTVELSLKGSKFIICLPIKQEQDEERQTIMIKHLS
jgi:signal transduction histidine kinase